MKVESNTPPASRYRMQIAVNITLPEQQRPGETVNEFIERVTAKVSAFYGQWQAYDASSACIEIVSGE